MKYYNSIEEIPEEDYLASLLSDTSEWDEEDVEEDVEEEVEDEEEDNDGLGSDGEPY